MNIFFKVFIFIFILAIFVIYYYGYKEFTKNQYELFKMNKTNYNNIDNDNNNYTLYPKINYLHLNNSINFQDLANKSNKTKTILYWNSFFGRKDFSLGLGNNVLKEMNCPITNCEFINDRKRLNQSDLVLVHMRDNIDTIPIYRPLNQRWVFVIYESPIHTNPFNKYNGVFNLTATYKLDSDFTGFYYAYSKMRWQYNPSFNSNYNFYGDKTKFAAILVSNCNDNSNRLKLVKKLQNYIDIDIFGNCGKPCKALTSYNENCRESIAKIYKFYLSFENSICNDYITEEFFEILKYNIIPITYGKGPYDYYVIIRIY